MLGRHHRRKLDGRDQAEHSLHWQSYLQGKREVNRRLECERDEARAQAEMLREKLEDAGEKIEALRLVDGHQIIDNLEAKNELLGIHLDKVLVQCGEARAEVERLRENNRSLGLYLDGAREQRDHLRETLQRWYHGGNRGETFETWIREREPRIFEDDDNG